MEKDKMLTLEDLEEIVGGRCPNQEEIDMWRGVMERFEKLQAFYFTPDRHDRWYYVEQKFNEAIEKWRVAVLNAPESSEAISFYDFFDFEKYERP